MIIVLRILNFRIAWTRRQFCDRQSWGYSSSPHQKSGGLDSSTKTGWQQKEKCELGNDRLVLIAQQQLPGNSFARNERGCIWPPRATIIPHPNCNVFLTRASYMNTIQEAYFRYKPALLQCASLTSRQLLLQATMHGYLGGHHYSICHSQM